MGKLVDEPTPTVTICLRFWGGKHGGAASRSGRDRESKTALIRIELAENIGILDVLGFYQAISTSVKRPLRNGQRCRGLQAQHPRSCPLMRHCWG